MKTRIWCEFTSPKDVCRDYVLKLLKKYDVTLNYKLEYGQVDDDFFAMLKTYNEAGIPISIWATLSDDMGYWINERNAHHFDAYIRALVENLESRGLKIEGVCIDMEAPLKDVRRIISPKNRLDACLAFGKLLTHNLNKKRYNAAKSILQETARFLREKGLESYSTSLRFCYYDLKHKTELVQNAMEVPVFDVKWDKYNLMYYATMMRQELKPLKKTNVDYMIYYQVMHLKSKLKDKLAISVGLTNTGKLGNEPYYESMEEFEKDIGILKACGVDDFALFSLDGINEEKKLEGFLKIMHNAQAFRPELCRRVLRNEWLMSILMRIGKVYYSFFR